MGGSLGVPTGPGPRTKPQQHPRAASFTADPLCLTLLETFFPFLSGTQRPPSRQQFRVSTSHASLRHTGPSVTLHDVQRCPVRLHGGPWLAARWRHPAVPSRLRHPRLAGVQGHADGQGGQPLRHGLCSLMQEPVQAHHEPAGWLPPEPGSRLLSLCQR